MKIKWISIFILVYGISINLNAKNDDSLCFKIAPRIIKSLIEKNNAISYSEEWKDFFFQNTHIAVNDVLEIVELPFIIGFAKKNDSSLLVSIDLIYAYEKDWVNTFIKKFGPITSTMSTSFETYIKVDANLFSSNLWSFQCFNLIAQMIPETDRRKDYLRVSILIKSDTLKYLEIER
ncbi:MAG: hypothetical protein ACKVOQ_01865 [Cyclobacteriaceae bacterium]